MAVSTGHLSTTTVAVTSQATVIICRPSPLRPATLPTPISRCRIQGWELPPTGPPPRSFASARTSHGGLSAPAGELPARCVDRWKEEGACRATSLRPPALPFIGVMPLVMNTGEMPLLVTLAAIWCTARYLERAKVLFPVGNDLRTNKTLNSFPRPTTGSVPSSWPTGPMVAYMSWTCIAK